MPDTDRAPAAPEPYEKRHKRAAPWAPGGRGTREPLDPHAPPPAPGGLGWTVRPAALAEDQVDDGPPCPPPGTAEDATDFDPGFGDIRLTEARQDIVIGRWQGVRDLFAVTGDNWPRRTHRLRVLSNAAAAGSVSETWAEAEPGNPDALVLRAATEVVRVFDEAIALHGGVRPGKGSGVAESRLDGVVRSCLRAADASPLDPAPWISLLTVARLYGKGVRGPELQRWWDGLRRRDPHNVEGHTQLLRYFSARWHGTHGRMYGFARDAAAVAPQGSPLPVLVQIARVEEFRYVIESAAAQGTPPPCETGQHWQHEIAVTDARRTYARWLGGRPEGPLLPEEVGSLNYLTHALCLAGLDAAASDAFALLGGRAARAPWSYTGDPEGQFTAYRRARRGAGRDGG
ncbi:hypothetical protein [Streptomyces sp. NBC_01497]|uniref:hypothetical protein n=1 Tax=Streptomyces sp. NBC_01497 TaxID=2903885 RepID=UPI002E37B185|nr:hypothetical protein [Streptomyces sp. NBC_01497]